MNWFVLLTLTLLFQITYGAEIIMRIGEQKKLKVPVNQSIQVGHRGIISVVDNLNSITIKAKKLGQTHIAYDNKNLNIKVIEKPLYELYLNLNESLENSLGLELNFATKKCHINGELLSLKDWKIVFDQQIHSTKNCQFKASIHPLIQSAVIDSLNEYINKHSIKGINISIEQNKVKLTAAKVTDVQKKYLDQLLKPWGLSLTVLKRVKARPPLVQVKLLLAEVSKSFSKNIGLNWSQNYQAQILPGADVSGNWLVQLNALEDDGHGRILASPTLVSESGGSAEFLAGGEFPIRNKSYRSSSISWKKHGLIFKIKPHVDDSEQIFLKIETEVSMLDMSNSVEGIPAIKVSRVQSQFNVKNGQAIALSGLIQYRKGASDSGIAGLKSLPVLGSLFSSESFQMERSELVVFVEPQIYKDPENIDFPKREFLNDNH